MESHAAPIKESTLPRLFPQNHCSTGSAATTTLNPFTGSSPDWAERPFAALMMPLNAPHKSFTGREHLTLASPPCE
jgi:hypothetical protein